MPSGDRLSTPDLSWMDQDSDLNEPELPGLRVGSPELPESRSPELPTSRKQNRPRPITGRRKASVARYQDYEEVPDSCDSGGEHTYEEVLDRGDSEGEAEEGEHAAKEDEHAAEEGENAVDEDEHAAEQESSTVKKTSEKKTSGKKTSGKKTGAKPRTRSSNLTDAQWTVIVSTDQTQPACASADCLPFYSVMPSPMAWSTPPTTTTRKSIVWPH
jgi:hypothetical protein